MINPLNTHYSFTNPASVHDEEALTALELAGRTTAKVNEVVKSQNDLVDTMKNEREVVIPNTIKEDVKNHIEKGTFDAQIDEHTADLIQQIEESTEAMSRQVEQSTEAMENHLADTESRLGSRLDNLLGSVESGSVTTRDAEVIDARVDVEGETHDNLGDAIRTQAYKRGCYGKVFTNNTPKVEVTDTSVRVTFYPTTHIFFNGRRYDMKTEKVAYYEDTQYATLLHVLAFNPNTEEISVFPSSWGMTAPFIHIGVVYKGIAYLNDWVQADTSFYSTHDHPLYVTTWCDTRPYAEEVDTLNFVLHFPNFYIYTGRTFIMVNAQSLNVKRSATNHSLHYLLYNPTTKEVSVLTHGARVGSDYMVVGFFHVGSMSITLLGQDFHHTAPQTPCALIGSQYSKFVEFDSVNKTVKFGDDTLILAFTDQQWTYYQLSEAKGNTTITWADFTTSAFAIYFDRVNDSLTIRAYNQRVEDNLILLCSVRTKTGIVSMNYPYTWDGKLYNVFNVNSAGEVQLDTNATTYGNVKGINHRGYCGVAPENTLAAFRLSKQNGFDIVECDVSFTSDDVAVLLHDDTIDRTSNGTGSISSMTYSEVSQYDFGSWFSSSFTGEPIPTFYDFIKLCRNLGLHPYIELKAGTRPQIESLVATVKSCGMVNNVTWISFNSTLLSYVKGVHSSARLGFVCGLSSDSIGVARSLKNADNDVFIDADISTITDELVGLCISNDLPLEVWTVNDNATILSLHPYVSGVTSDTIHAGKALYDYNI